MAGQPLFSNYMGLDPLLRTLGGGGVFNEQGAYDFGRADKGTQALSGYMTPSNSWYAQNFGMGGSIPDFVENVYKHYLGRGTDEAGKEFWNSRADLYRTGGTEDTADDKSRADTQAWLATHIMSSPEFGDKYAQEQAGPPADYKDKADWQGYRNNARMQTQALNNLPYTLDPGKLSPTDTAANKATMFPAQLQQGGVPRQVIGGVNIAPTVDAANNYAGLTSELAKLGLEGDALSQVMELVKNAANYEKGEYGSRIKGVKTV